MKRKGGIPQETVIAKMPRLKTKLRSVKNPDLLTPEENAFQEAYEPFEFTNDSSNSAKTGDSQIDRLFNAELSMEYLKSLVNKYDHLFDLINHPLITRTNKVIFFSWLISLSPPVGVRNFIKIKCDDSFIKKCLTKLTQLEELFSLMPENKSSTHVISNIIRLFSQVPFFSKRAGKLR